MFQAIDELIKERSYEPALNALQDMTGEVIEESVFLQKLAYTAFSCNKNQLSRQTYSKLFDNGDMGLIDCVNYAKLLLKNKEIERAEAVFELAQISFYNNVSVLRLGVSVYKELKNTEKETQLCYKLVELYSDNSLNYRLLIDVLVRDKKYELAQDKLCIALEKFEDNDFKLLNIKILVALEKWEESLPIYQQMREENPLNYAVYLGAAKALNQLGRLEESIEWMLAGLEHADDKKNIIATLGSHYLRCGELNKSEEYFEELIKIDSKNITNYKRLSSVLVRLQKYKKALEVMSEAEKEFRHLGRNTEQMFQIHITKSDIYSQLENWDKAIFEIDYALDIQPKNCDAYISLVQIKLKLYQFDRAENILQYILHIDPNNQKARNFLIAVERERKRREIEVRSYTKFEKIVPETIADYIAKIDLCAEFLGSEEAIYTCFEGLKKDELNPAILVRLITLLLRSEQIEEVKKYWSILLNNNEFSYEFLSLMRVASEYSGSATSLIEEMLQKMQERLSNNLLKLNSDVDKINKIAILGGSNSIMRDGWSPVFIRQTRQIFNIEVDNYGLGGISSLYGLTIARQKKLFEEYDLVIFEYTLNDIYFNQFVGYNHDVLASVVRGMTSEAEKYDSKVLFLLMSPMDNLEILQSANCPITNIYKGESQSENAAIYSVHELIENRGYSQEYIKTLYRDNMHYRALFAQELADNIVFDILSAKAFEMTDIHYNTTGREMIDLDDLRFIPPSEYNIDGDSHYILRETKIISEDFLCLKPESSISLKVEKGMRVLGVLINSSENTGYIKVQFGNEVFVKNIFAERPIGDPVKARIYLKQFTKTLFASDGEVTLTLSTNVTQKDLDNLELDITVYPQPPRASLGSHELEIAGVLVSGTSL